MGCPDTLPCSPTPSGAVVTGEVVRNAVGLLQRDPYVGGLPGMAPLAPGAAAVVGVVDLSRGPGEREPP